MLVLVVVILSVIAIVALFVKLFFTVDGDLTLLSKGAPKREQVEGRVTWITGASRGIGEDLAKQFASLGAKLILSARNVLELERVKSELVGRYPQCQVEILPLDLSADEDALQEAVQKAESFFSSSGVYYMVHNAAFERPKTSSLEVNDEGLKMTFMVNVFGTITLTRLLSPFMLKRGRGHFIVMSSAAGKTPAPGQAIYSASKYALNGFFHTFRSELCQKGIKVTVVCPGPIDTSRASGSNTGGGKRVLQENRVTSERCACLTISAATHGLKEAWISNQPVLFVMYLVQYMHTLGYWLMDKIGATRVEAAAKKTSTYGWNLFLGGKKKTT